LIAYGWPEENGGYGIALQSALDVYIKHFDKIVFLGLSDKSYKNENIKNVIFLHLPINRKTKFNRFVLSLFSRYPAISHQYRSFGLKNDFINQLKRIDLDQDALSVIFEDLTHGVLIEEIKKIYPNADYILKSHNVMSNIFSNVGKKNILYNVAWKYESYKIAKYEKELCRNFDTLWAITENNRTEYEKLGYPCQGVFGVSINLNKYAKVPEGNVSNVVYIGSFDIRKTEGIIDFIHNSWSFVYKNNPHSRLILAGKGSENFSDESMGIISLGRVEDDIELLEKGFIFINPQNSGSGVKLKSLVAMAAGKLLVSTEIGVEGILGKNNKHFVVSPLNEFGKYLNKIIDDPSSYLLIAQNGRNFVNEFYSKDRLIKDTEKLFN
jgi:glycosyltransferase involved in cell wall biosynthesis